MDKPFVPPSDVKAARLEFGRILQSLRAPLPPKRWHMLLRLWPKQQNLQSAHEYDDDDITIDSLPMEMPSVAAPFELIPQFEAEGALVQEKFWHLETDYDEVIESHLRVLVNTRLSRLENGAPVLRKREELVSLASAEAYTFLIHFLSALFGLREYEVIDDEAILQGKHRRLFGDWQSALNAATIMKLPPELMCKITTRIEALRAASDAYRPALRHQDNVRKRKRKQGAQATGGEAEETSDGEDGNADDIISAAVAPTLHRTSGAEKEGQLKILSLNFDDDTQLM